MARLSRFHGFLLASGLLIACVIVAAGLLVGRFFEERVLAHEADHLVDDVQHHARQYLAPEAFELPSTLPRTSGFASVFESLRGVFRVKAYDLNGRIVWSNEPRLIGKAFPDNPHLLTALGGRVTTVFGTPRKRENIYEKTRGYIVEVYVPIILPGSSQVIGVIEPYRDTTALVLGIHRTQRWLWVVSGTMGAFLYASLAVVVWRASAGERRAISGLEKQNQELTRMEERLRAANQALLVAQAELVKKERLAAVGQVVVGLHHTILNPLTGILGALQVLKQGSLDPPQEAQAIAEAEQQIGKIEQVVKRLRNLERADGMPYLGGTSMLDLEPSSEEEAAAPVGNGDAS